MDLETVFPVSFGAWHNDESEPAQVISPVHQALMNKLYNSTLARTYVRADGVAVMLSVAYGGDQSDGTRAHRPDVCYPAQGFDVLSLARGTLDVTSSRLPVMRMHAKSLSRSEPITYWFVVGEEPVLSGVELKLARLSHGLRGIVQEGMLVRVSTIDSQPIRAFEVHAQFVQALHAAIAPEWRPRVFGRDSATSVQVPAADGTGSTSLTTALRWHS